jgi:hypothetical protein
MTLTTVKFSSHAAGNPEHRRARLYAQTRECGPLATPGLVPAAPRRPHKHRRERLLGAPRNHPAFEHLVHPRGGVAIAASGPLHARRQIRAIGPTVIRLVQGAADPLPDGVPKVDDRVWRGARPQGCRTAIAPERQTPGVLTSGTPAASGSRRWWYRYPCGLAGDGGGKVVPDAPCHNLRLFRQKTFLRVARCTFRIGAIRRGE